MYKQATIDGDALYQMATAERPNGPHFPSAKVEQADCMDVWCTSILEGGPDFTRFDLKKDGVIIASAVIRGY